MSFGSLVLMTFQLATVTSVNRDTVCTMWQEQGDERMFHIRSAMIGDQGQTTLTVLNEQRVPVRIIPFAPGSLYTAQSVKLTGIPSGNYIFRVTMAGRAEEKFFVIEQL
ncbi:hypothetical protein [Chitinophaga sp. Cy-1792]|uniref:hypothetical protein n=1 Tax=Chitinophaga sp. Cy-1792 TaxID=2608339 RepID=UPI001421A36E|nr:hypothetical protein [Chitinophaga sp. Cy-1792]NIG56200.1 hypothetical protein [Chitinophaga sp. Cy-1792]